jgi:hypothetical protein
VWKEETEREIIGEKVRVRDWELEKEGENVRRDFRE